MHQRKFLNLFLICLSLFFGSEILSQSMPNVQKNEEQLTINDIFKLIAPYYLVYYIVACAMTIHWASKNNYIKIDISDIESLMNASPFMIIAPFIPPMIFTKLICETYNYIKSTKVKPNQYRLYYLMKNYCKKSLFFENAYKNAIEKHLKNNTSIHLTNEKNENIFEFLSYNEKITNQKVKTIKTLINKYKKKITTINLTIQSINDYFFTVYYCLEMKNHWSHHCSDFRCEIKLIAINLYLSFIDINKLNKRALHWFTLATLVGKDKHSIKVIKLLLKNNFNPNTTFKGYTTLHSVARVGDWDRYNKIYDPLIYNLATILLENNTNLNVVNNDNLTPTQILFENHKKSSSKLMTLLLQHGGKFTKNDHSELLKIAFCENAEKKEIQSRFEDTLNTYSIQEQIRFFDDIKLLRERFEDISMPSYLDPYVKTINNNPNEKSQNILALID